MILAAGDHTLLPCTTVRFRWLSWKGYVVAYRSITPHPTCDNANPGQRLTVGRVGGGI
jgi:hypothetical protein